MVSECLNGASVEHSPVVWVTKTVDDMRSGSVGIKISGTDTVEED